MSKQTFNFIETVIIFTRLKQIVNNKMTNLCVFLLTSINSNEIFVLKLLMLNKLYLSFLFIYKILINKIVILKIYYQLKKNYF